MKLLALDTATESCSVALWLDAAVTAEAIEIERGHAERILPMIDALLGGAGLALGDLDAIAVGRGPGGFTGVRLGVSVAQGLALGSGLAAIGISNLAAVAQRALDAHPDAARVLVCNDARMNEVYTGLYERGADGLAALAGAESVTAPGRVILPPADVPTIGAGRGFRAWPELAARFGTALGAVETELLPRAEEIVRLAAAELARGGAVEAATLVPIYLRDDVARPSTRR